MKIVSWDGLSINNGSNYKAWFPARDFNPRSLPRKTARAVARSGYWPVLGSVDRPPHTLVVYISIEGAAVSSLRLQLQQRF